MNSTSTRIVILDKGFVSVGRVSETTTGLKIEDAYVVRCWGTTRGLGEIAAGGPTTSTILDKTPTQYVPLHSVVNMIECDADKWAPVLAGTASK